jgi:hypothetical protein
MKQNSNFYSFIVHILGGNQIVNYFAVLLGVMRRSLKFKTSVKKYLKLLKIDEKMRVEENIRNPISTYSKIHFTFY